MDISKERIEAQAVSERNNEALHAGHHSPLTLLVIGTETGVFDESSEAAKRIFSYGQYFKEVHIVVLSGAEGLRASRHSNVHMYPASGGRIMRVVRALRLARRVGKYDIVTAQDPFENGFVAWRAARRRHAKLHVQVHTDPFNAGYASHSLINFVRLYIALFVLKRADGIRVVSDRIKTSIEKRLKPKRTIAILPIYVDVRRIREAQLSPDLSQRFAKFSTKLLLVSRLEKEKNPALALRAFARAAPADACLMILGEGRLRLHLIAEARKLRITERVFFEGTKDVAPYYKLADLVLVPSKYEGYGRVFIEASAAGRPILSTDVGIAREVGAIIADEQHFAEALKRWFENGPRTSELTSYPYTSFDEYLREYCFDIVSLV